MKLVALSFALAAIGAPAPAGPSSNEQARAEQSKKIHEVYERKFGGFVVQPGSMAGKIGFVDAQSDLPRAEISNVVATIRRGLPYRIDVLGAPCPAPLPTAGNLSEKGLNAAVYVVSDDALPALLVSPEENWSIVNVRKFREGLSDDVLGRRLFALRCRGELMRGFAQACGIWTSDYKDNILDALSPQELDSMKVDSLVADMLQRCKTHLARIGVTQARKAMYTRACQEGWAPPPTNDVQKAIWDKVRQLPANPIKIEYDPARGR
ncbi:MAG: hypothetical protein IJ829_07535 [Kiritimatiellae bacterium]|nr:hypothetical protein [Kiritimatiellia bacterium]